MRNASNGRGGRRAGLSGFRGGKPGEDVCMGSDHGESHTSTRKGEGNFDGK